LFSDTSFRDGSDWSFRLTETQSDIGGTYPAISIPELIDQYDIEVIDFLKIDIEGGEVSVFSTESNLNWLKSVKVLAIEIHDEFNCRAVIENTLVDFGFSISHSGELTIAVNKNLF